MSFKQVGTLARAVLQEAMDKRAAAATNSAAGFRGDEPVAQGDGPSSSPIAQAPGRTEASNSGMKKAGFGGDRTQPVKGGRQQSGGTVVQNGTTNEHRVVSALPYVSRSITTASNTTPHRESFARSAVVIDLAMYRASRHDLTVPW